MVLNNDELKAIYNEYVEKIYKYFYVRVQSTEVSQDLTSTTFMKLIDKYDSFNPDKGNISQYIYTIARNTLIDYYRSNKNKKNVNIENIEEVCNKEEDNSVVLDRNRDILMACIKKLPDEDQQLIHLRYTLEYSYKEIADELGLPINTVSIKIHRVHKKLKVILQKNNLKFKLEI
ncbi:MAG TPA: sigma-70 family RNA polymerase sigma factor [Candidatus Dojkabacteria bacterium]|nr:sigma-70 family RNA polymerase sigma factor [Candidatus Dojkabacteria bacterium]